MKEVSPPGFSRQEIQTAKGGYSGGRVEILIDS